MKIFSSITLFAHLRFFRELILFRISVSDLFHFISATVEKCVHLFPHIISHRFRLLCFPAICVLSVNPSLNDDAHHHTRTVDMYANYFMGQIDIEVSWYALPVVFGLFIFEGRVCCTKKRERANVCIIVQDDNKNGKERKSRRKRSTILKMAFFKCIIQAYAYMPLLRFGFDFAH